MMFAFLITFVFVLFVWLVFFKFKWLKFTKTWGVLSLFFAAHLFLIFVVGSALRYSVLDECESRATYDSTGSAPCRNRRWSPPCWCNRMFR